jgi:hypothetical protein
LTLPEFSMRKIISLICFLLPTLAFAAQPVTRPELRSDAPDRHVVVKGDTLWDISGKFFKDPWRWPYIWGMNKDSIKDPHWIYPGDVIVLDRVNGTLRIGDSASGSNIIRLSPRARDEQSEHDAIPSIPAKAIAPFLSKPLVIEADALKSAPAIIGAREGRVMLGINDVGFASGLSADKGSKWHIYRPGKTFTDPDSPEGKEVLGIEAVYLGDAEVTDFADVSTIAITQSVQEINKGDRLVAPSEESAATYLPRAPATDISARVISVYGGVSQGGQNTVITLSKGIRDGLERGHVLALYRKGESVRNEGANFTLPDERYGLAFVFRVFDKVSYALVMQTRLPVQLLDRARTP